MKTTTASARNIGCLIALMVSCGQLMTGFNRTKQDIWAGILFSAFISLPLFAVLLRIIKLNPGKDLFEIISDNFGRVSSFILIFLISLYALAVSALVTRNFSEFVSTISLEKTPDPLIIAGMILAAAYLTGSNYNIMGRWAITILIAVNIILVLTFCFSIPYMDLTNLKPVLQEHSLGEIISSGTTFGAIAFGELVLVISAFGSLKPSEKPLKSFVIGIGIGVLMLLVTILRNVLVLGRDMVDYSLFPSFVATRVLSVGNFVEHLESVISFVQILVGITKAAICLRAAALGAQKLLKNRFSIGKVIIPIAAAAAIISAAAFDNMKQMLQFAEPYKYYAAPFAIGIPVVIWIKSESSRRLGNSKP